ncbi:MULTISPECIES: aldo/keto reductase [unclassified Aureimonas]|uniref:aldo/keto reductase n=1 Tax=unclassified Aureimonas TaxID=2615206 RepID=UPI0006FB6E9D|nr:MULTISPECIES: aldo/keto reductase [unclassified Aureimonas]KQT60295.1 2,5-didehydrogluconate reductase [Aureimonas sp. Leaf427]KQT79171.1 2,5-didehydrogluconate reductase [Aureimonas sp. Leaf460]
MKIIEANGARIPAIGFGTYTLKGEAATDMVAKAIEAGYRHIDTARMYENEAEVGAGIRAAGLPRDELFVTTKIWRDDLAADRFAESADRAIEALGIGPVDLLLIHWPNADIPLEETIEALNAAKARGLTRHIGVANFPSPLLDEAAALSPSPLVCNQVEYHPFLAQEAVLGACERHGMALVAYSPLGQGGDILEHPLIVGIASKHGKTPSQVILNWEVSQDRVAAIPRTKNPDRLAINLDVFGFELDAEEKRSLDELSRQRRRLIDPQFAPVWDRV